MILLLKQLVDKFSTKKILPHFNQKPDSVCYQASLGFHP